MILFWRNFEGYLLTIKTLWFINEITLLNFHYNYMVKLVLLYQVEVRDDRKKEAKDAVGVGLKRGCQKKMWDSGELGCEKF